MSQPSSNPYNGLLAMLTVTLLLLALYSFSDIDLPLKRTSIANYFRSADTAVVVESIALLDTVSGVDTTHRSILLIGDSMLEGLSPRFLDYAIQNRHTLNAVLWYGSSTKSFGTCDTLSHFIRKYQPSLILLSLGTNELFIRDIINERSKYVEHILSEIDTIPYIWIGPPNWRDDTGINTLIEQHVGHKRFYPSKRLQYERARDGAHPTHKSAAMWADSVSRWIMDSSVYRIVMEMPDTTVHRTGNGIKELIKQQK